MDIRRFVLSFYKDAAEDFHIQRITRPAEALKLHTHDYFQIYYINKGEVLHHLAGACARLSYGDVFILPPNVPHYIEVFGTDVDFYSLSFMPGFFDKTEDRSGLAADFLHYLQTAAMESIHPRFSLQSDDILFTETIFHRIMDEFVSERIGKREIIHEYVSLLLSLFARTYFAEHAESILLKTNRELILHCLTYIENHYNEEITLAEITRHSAMSKTCFCSLFSSVTGTSFKNYLNTYRIRKACEMIRSGEKISNVSTRCGYSDFSTFYRNFRKYMSISPAQYQKLYR